MGPFLSKLTLKVTKREHFVDINLKTTSLYWNHSEILLLN